MAEQILKVNGVEICAESFGKPTDPAILLIMGAQMSMLWWEEEFCQRIADAGRFVIRFDNRDVGRSTTYEVGQPGYAFEDMADDAVHILDAFGVQQSHIVGMSMGGLLTQFIALRHPERVRTITLHATSNFAPDLPPIDEKLMEFFSNMGEINWEDEQEVLAAAVASSKVLIGSKHPFDEARVRELAQIDIARSNHYASKNNHAFVTTSETYLMRTGEIAVPALVIHGTEDLLIPFAHALHLANTIPGAVLLTLEGTGHELPRGDWDVVIEAILKHTSGRRVRL
ncbi:alpha/beta fold hydrolase [Brevibacillus sp. BC25]|uniref:alpha/beta fold hydrolase n=1 Tax=Brevibacillus sp. BC25 TaxID=1144308 RepID=UPI000271295A|nr:alpha/beta hydrolase [Brevibacillus sp. BC25]EJL26187.1 putative hydrolase or acyltransferase of alpha/beta superfamily [Brevibacillus sp. BC25]